MSFFRGFAEGFKLFGKTISGIVNVILLSFVYFIGVGLTSIVCKIGGKKFLEMNVERERDSYWEDRDDKKGDHNRMF